MSMFVLIIYGVLFSLHFISYECEGKIISPPDGTELTLLPGSNKNITWKFDDVIAKVSSRIWSFTSTAGSGEVTLGIISFNSDPVLRKENLPKFKIIKPDILELSNVNQSYDGTYHFRFKVDGQPDDKSGVKVYIAVTPIVTVNCSRVTTGNKSDYFACECKGTGGNPPADVTWFKGNKALVTGQEKAILRLPNVKKEDNGTYICQAKSHEEAKNDTEIELIVHFPPENTILNYEDKSLTITCDAEASPPPRFEIYVNETELVKSDKTYTIPARNNSYAGNYTCVAVNTLGRSSSLPKYISFGAQPTSRPATISSQKITTTPQNIATVNTAANMEGDGTTVVVWHIVVSLVSGIIIGILVSYIVWCSHRRWFSGNRNSERNPEPQTTEVDTTYQELDLSKMNKEDNYQSLRVNAASNDDDSTYTELNKTRDVRRTTINL